MLNELHFLRPYWLLALLPLIVAVVLYARRRPGLLRWADVVDAHLAPHVLVGGAAKSRRIPSLLIGISGLLGILALAGPAWQKLPQLVFASESALVIVLDLSNSMNTQDIKPSRIERARFKVADILERRDEGQTALIVYAADAFVVSPLTDDVATIAAQLSALAPELMPSQGSRSDIALKKARDLLEQAGRSQGEILLITDGADNERSRPVVEGLVESGYRVSVLGVGTVEGGPVPGPGGFIRQRDGSIVIAALDRDALRELSFSGGGLYRDLSADDRDIEQLSGILDSLQPTDVTEKELDADQWREEGPWLLLVLLPLAALAFRRGILAVFALVFLLPVAPVKAAGFSDLWLRPDQRAARQLEQGDAERAAELFEDPSWKGAASYRAGNYEGALEALAELDTAEAAYNRGNALARLGRFEEAIAAYANVLERDPDNADAEFNRDLLLEQMQNQQKQSDSGDESGEDSGEQGEQGQQDGEQGQQDGEQQQSGGSEGQQPQQDQKDASSGPGSPDQQPGEETDETRAATENDDSGEQSQEDQAEATAESSESDEAEQPADAAQVASTDELPNEAEQAVEQWLRRIPDDPGGLLRRKFLYQYQQQEQAPAEQEPW